MLRAAGIPFWRLSSFYFFYFAVLGSWLPFWNLYLADSGYSTADIGYLYAIMLATKVIAPALWGWLADRTGQRIAVIRVGCFFTFIILALVFLEPQFWGMFAVIFGFSFFWNAVLPQFEAVTIEHLGEHFAQYSKVRLWGSIGFIAAVLGLGQVFVGLSIQTLPWFIIVLLGLMFLSSLSINNPTRMVQQTQKQSVKTIVRNPAVIAFLVVVALQQFAHGPYYTFYSIYLEAKNYSTLAIGSLWSLGVLAEIVLFAYMHRILPRYGVRRILLVSLWLSVARWLLLGTLADSVFVVVSTQLLHAASFGACHAVAIEFIRDRFAGAQGMGQALYSGLSFGLGGALGAIASGYLWEQGALISFSMAALASFIALIIAWCFISEDKTSKLPTSLETELL